MNMNVGGPGHPLTLLGAQFRAPPPLPLLGQPASSSFCVPATVSTGLPLAPPAPLVLSSLQPLHPLPVSLNETAPSRLHQPGVSTEAPVLQAISGPLLAAKVTPSVSVSSSTSSSTTTVPSTPSQSAEGQPLDGADVKCLVCGDSNAQNHYGTVCCPSCKGFFRRSFLASKNLECYRGNCCVITKGTRNNCRACRYKKCLNAGMNPNEIRHKQDGSDERSSSPMEIKVFGEQSDSSSQPANIVALPQIGVPSVDPLFMNAEEAKLLASFYVNLERYCDNSVFNGNEICLQEEEFLINQMLDASVEDLLMKRRPQCPRFPIIWKPHQMVSGKTFKRIYARLVVFFCDWVNHIPLFKSLCVSDKVQLFIARLTQVLLLNMCYRTYKEGCGGLLLGTGSVFPFDKALRSQIEDDQIRNMLSQVVDSVFADVIFPMKDLDINEDEYCMLKATLFLFEGFPFNQLTDHGKEVLVREKQRHKAALVALILQKKEANPAIDHLFKLIQVEHLTTTIEAVSNYIDKEFGLMNLFSLSGMRGNLVHECHVMKYAFC